MMKILLVSDQSEYSDHSAVEGLFRKAMEPHAEVSIVYFSRVVKIPNLVGGRIILPHSAVRRGLVAMLGKLLDLQQYNFVIVRNHFPALAQVLAAHLTAKVGFWESFPHSYRRLEEAYLHRLAIWRKRLEYSWRARREKALVSRCDFYLPVTRVFRDEFHATLGIPFHPTPMGIDLSLLPELREEAPDDGPLRFVYIGTIDALRRCDMVNQAFMAVSGDFVLDYYTGSDNEIVDAIRNCGDPRIRVHDALPRAELFRELAKADVGVCFVPLTRTYIVSNPTKTIEYCALGLPVLSNNVPEYEELLPDDTAFLTDFDYDKIVGRIESVLALSRTEIRAIGKRARGRVLAEREYSVLAERLSAFLSSLPESTR